MNYIIPFDPSISKKVLIKYIIEGFSFNMNPVILYNLLLPILHFICTWGRRKWNFFDFTNGRAGSYIRIGGRFPLSVERPPVGIYPMVMFYSEE